MAHVAASAAADAPPKPEPQPANAQQPAPTNTTPATSSHPTAATELDVLGARRAHSRLGFASGFDPAAPDQHERREARAKRFADQFVPDAQVAARNARAERFGGDARQLVADATVCNDPLERRRDVAVGELPRPNVLHLFGVDLLTTSQVLSHFHEYGPSWCEWLNDSSCNIAFEDEHTMKRALRGLTDHAKRVGMDDIVESAPEDRMDDGAGAGLGLSVAADGTLAEELTWRSGKPFEKGNVLLPIWIRQATEKDRRPEMPNPKSKWSRTVNTKKRISQRRSSDSATTADAARRRRRNSDSNASADVQRATRRGSAPGVHHDKKMAILKAQTRKVTRMDLDRALES
ncbi:Nuclear cap-binding protein subunit 3 [Gracilariopsis chorda]|uniref:Nuclear cap-binding protein subunit 3 n=1 Tax=Gracilariopsis chorda TaxID=448386 RepID=A0A2V3IN16_9FLOR|nr:Nuclear cap-binding protein subunit 3 [Gracilariopsis chorda]|eukprot:PXF43462.1 Nuclear cap-binding protein subunit 3 [Gracilariopsis chorda]